MPRNAINSMVNLTDTTAKRDLMARLGRLTGLYEVRVEPRRETRTTQQNRYYFGVVVRSFCEYMADQGQPIPTLEAHGFLKRKFLPLDLVNPVTGEVMDTIADTSHDKDIAAFAAYIDQCIHWLGTTFGIVVPDPQDYTPAIPAGQPTPKPEDF